MDRGATLFFPPAVLLTTLIFASVSALVRSWGRIPGSRTLDGNIQELIYRPALHA